MSRFRFRRRNSIPKSLVAGALGGLAASYAMNRFQALWSSTEQKLKESLGAPRQSEGGGSKATEKAADAIARRAIGHELAERDKKVAAPAVHYAFGTLIGAAYGVLAEAVPAASAGNGMVYAGAVWLGGDEIAVPALGLSGPPSETPVASHTKALASHLVYGLVTDVTRKLVLKI